MGSEVAEVSNKGEAIWAAAQEIKMQEHLRRVAEYNARNEKKKLKNRAVDCFDKERMRTLGTYKQ